MVRVHRARPLASPLPVVAFLATLVAAPFAGAEAFGAAEQLTAVDPALHPWSTGETVPFPGAVPPFVYGALPARLTPFGDLLFFVADDGLNGAEPWVSDGTPGGTAPLADLCPGDCSSLPRPLGALGDRVVFFAATPGAGTEPWVSDGTPAGTHRLDDLCPGPCDASPPVEPWWNDNAPDLAGRDGVVLGGELFFAATDGDGPGLFATDGESVRRLLQTFEPPRHLTLAGDRFAFTVGPARLWWSDGTVDGTRPAEAHCPPDRIVTLVHPPVAFADGVAFAAGCGGPLGQSPTSWLVFRLRPDGTFTLLRSFAQPPLALVVDRGALVIALRDAAGPALVPNVALFESDGTRQGTVRRRNLLLDTASDVVAFAGKLYVAGAAVVSVPDGPRHFFFELDPGASNPRQLEREAVVAGSVREAGGYLVWWETPPDPPLGDGPPGLPYDLRLMLYPGYGEPVEAARFVTARVGPDGGEKRLAPPGFAAVGDDLLLSADGGDGQQLWKLAGGLAGPDPCADDPRALCLRDGRFVVRVRFTNQHADGLPGNATPDAASRQLGGDTGYFWFFRPGNLELAVKVLDGRPVNGHWWVFAGGSTDLGYEVEVTDLATGARRRLGHSPGDLCGVLDTAAFAAPPGGEPSAPLPPPVLDSGCGESLPPGALAGAACVGGDGGRFEIGVGFVNQHAGGATGVGTGAAYTPDTAVFRFFPRGGTELLVKVLDGRPVNGHWWVLWGGLTDLGYTLTVSDRTGGGSRTYGNPPGGRCGGADTRAF